MATSTYYKNLNRRHNELKKYFLPRSYSPTGSYKDSTYEKVAAYKLLIHAELEYYFEQAALNIAKDAITKWDSRQMATRTLVALIAYCPLKFPSIPEGTNDQKAQQDLDDRIHQAFTDYNKVIRSQNHGIKEANILSIFLPIGLTITDIDNNLLAELNSFGSDRGSIAHSTKAKQQTPPEDAENTISHIFSLVKVFDENLCKDYGLK